MVVVGRIVAPFGVRGWLKVRPFSDDSSIFEKASQWWLAEHADAPEESRRSFVPEVVKPHADGIIVKLLGIDDRTAAEKLDGYFVSVLRSDLPALSSSEYYWDDLIGLVVSNLQGHPLGKVISMIETGAHDVLVVRDAERERLLPFVDPIIKLVDIPGGVIRADWESDW
jgi:16S rRNA processing protein RimM